MGWRSGGGVAMAYPNEERDWGTQFPKDGLLFRAKMKREQGVVVSDASELLFEDIKKLNAQQRPDVPTCLIYAPISLLPMSTKHQHISTFLNSHTLKKSMRRLELWDNLQTFSLFPAEVWGDGNGCRDLQFVHGQSRSNTLHAGDNGVYTAALESCTC